MAKFSRITRRRRWLWHILTLLSVLGLLAVLVPGRSGAVLGGSPSNFESSDGNMTVEGPTGQATSALDWNCFANTVKAGFATNVDTGAGTCPSLTAAQIAKVQIQHPGTTEAASRVETTWKSGQKLDASCPVTNNSSVPNKDDFTDIAQYFEVGPSPDLTPYLYGAEIRSTANGNSSGNIEFNQLDSSQQPSLSCNWWRSLGDRLLAFDFVSGGTTLDFHALTWITSNVAGSPGATAGGNNGTCFIGHNTPPCWGASVLSGTNQGGGISIGGCNTSGNQVEGCSNQSAIGTDQAGKTLNGISGKNLVTNQFAEFGVNLDVALGISGCSDFAQEVWESRSSGSSFTSNPEDIEILNENISNCGSITIVKNTSPTGVNQSFSYTASSTPSNSNFTDFNLNPDSSQNTDCSSPGSATCAGSKEFSGLAPGTYTVTETAAAGFTLDSLTCTNNLQTATNAVADTSTGEVTITLAPNDNEVCTYVNDENLGAIKITKVSTKSNSDTLSGASFQVCTKDGPYDVVVDGQVTNPCTAPTGVTNDVGPTGNNGVVCVDGLPWSGTGTDYYVHETTQPTGYALNSTIYDLKVTANATCPVGTTAGTGTPKTQTVQDTPLTELTVSATSEVTGTNNSAGGTKSSINCTDSSTTPNSIGSSDTYPTNINPASVDIKDLSPGTYICTVVIDP